MNENLDLEMYEIYMSVTTPGGQKLNLRRGILKDSVDGSWDPQELMGHEIDYSARALKDALGEYMATSDD